MQGKKGQHLYGAILHVFAHFRDAFAQQIRVSVAYTWQTVHDLKRAWILSLVLWQQAVSQLGTVCSLNRLVVAVVTVATD